MNALDKLKVLCAAATEGPWEIEEWETDDGVEVSRIVNHNGERVLADEICDEDAAFIAAARTALPALIELVEAYRRLLAAKANAELSNAFGRAVLTQGYVDAVAEYNEATYVVEKAWMKLEEACPK